MKPAFLLLILSACTTRIENSSSTASVTDTPEGAEIEKLLKGYYQDMSARNWKKYRSYFWDNATITTEWQEEGETKATIDVTSVDDFIQETPNGPDSQPIFEEKMKDSVIKTQGNLATAWVNYSAKFGTKEKLTEWEGTDVFTLMRHEGQWKIISLVFQSSK